MASGMNLDELILQRLRQSPPKDCTVVPGSTPVIGFGRFRTAQVATVSLNPSYREFDIVQGERRFHTLDSLGLGSYKEFTENDRDMALDYCERYFERPGIYYCDWFDRVEEFVKSSTGASYFDGTACHLDISQWATTDVWGDLTPMQRKSIVSDSDLEIIRELIVQGPYDTLLLNGKRTAKQVLKSFKVPYKTIVLRETFKSQTGKTKYKVKGYSACIDKLLGRELGRKVQIFGWNLYIKYAGQDSLDLIGAWVSKGRK